MTGTDAPQPAEAEHDPTAAHERPEIKLQVDETVIERAGQL